MKVENLGDIVEAGKRHAAAELKLAVARARAELAGRGVGAGSAVALIQGNEASFFTNLLAAWELGACVVPLPPGAAQAELDWWLAHSGAGVVVRDGQFRELAGGGVAPPAGSAVLLYTSGSTGQPKGVVLSAAAVRAKIDALLRVLEPEVLRHTLCFVPVSFGHGLLGNSLPALLSGQTLFLEPGLGAGASLQLGALVDRHAITFLSSVPATWQAALPFSPPPAGGSLRRVFCASAPLAEADAARVRAWIGPGATLHNVYGLTEAASWIAELGGATFGCELRADPATAEIQVKAPYLMSGYHRDPAATAQALDGEWFRTGDLGELRGGKLVLAGRLKDLINRGGMKVSPLEVERRLLEHPDILEACVLGLPDSVTGETVRAAVRLRPGAAPGSAALRDFCRQALSEHKVPERFLVLAELPHTARGKVDKAALRRLLGEDA